MEASPADRCSSGVPGLDDVLGGGLPCGRLYLVEGTPGAGKTTLALQFLRAGCAAGEVTLLVSLSESRAELEAVAASHGWSLDGIELLEMSSIDELLRQETQSTVFHPAEIELNAVSGLLRETLVRLRPRRVVFDSLSEFRLLADLTVRYRHQLLALKTLLAGFGTTALLLDDRNFRDDGADPHVRSIVHGVIELQQLAPEYGRPRRRLWIPKLRGTSYREGYHDYAIRTGGLEVFPRLMAAEHHAPFVPQPVQSGVPELDALLGGGIDRGTTTLVVGPAGTGKSSLALCYAHAMAEQGERALVFAFDETVRILMARAAALGLPLEAHRAADRIDVQQADPAEIGPGEFAARVRAGVQAGAKLVVIDSLNGYFAAMPGEAYVPLHVHELCMYLNQQGVATMLVLAEHGLLGEASPPFDLSYIADTVITLRYFESGGAVHQALAVLKKRSGGHERTIREFRLEPGLGVRVGEPLRAFSKVMSGQPEYRGEAAAFPHEG